MGYGASVLSCWIYKPWWFFLFRRCEEGGLDGLMVSWPMDALILRVPYIEGSKVTVFDTQKVGVWLFGFAEARCAYVSAFTICMVAVSPCCDRFSVRAICVLCFDCVDR